MNGQCPFIPCGVTWCVGPVWCLLMHQNLVHMYPDPSPSIAIYATSLVTDSMLPRIHLVVLGQYLFCHFEHSLSLLWYRNLSFFFSTCVQLCWRQARCGPGVCCLAKQHSTSSYFCAPRCASCENAKSKWDGGGGHSESHAPPGMLTRIIIYVRYLTWTLQRCPPPLKSFVEPSSLVLLHSSDAVHHLVNLLLERIYHSDLDDRVKTPVLRSVVWANMHIWDWGQSPYVIMQTLKRNVKQLSSAVFHLLSLWPVAMGTGEGVTQTPGFGQVFNFNIYKWLKWSCKWITDTIKTVNMLSLKWSVKQSVHGRTKITSLTRKFVDSKTLANVSIWLVSANYAGTMMVCLVNGWQDLCQRQVLSWFFTCDRHF